MAAAEGADKGWKRMRAAIDTRTFDPVYYLHGDDDVLKEQAVQRLVAASLDPATRDFNLEVRRGTELDAETLGTMLSTPPMMAERRVIVVREVGALRKDARALLDRYLATPAPDAVVVLTSSAGDKADKELAAKSTPVRFDALNDAQLASWITRYVAEDLGATITPQALSLLREAVGTELSQLRTELDKLASFVGGGEIDGAAVEAVVGVRRGETLGDLLDAVAMREGARALALVPVVLQQPKASAVTTLLALGTQTMALAWARAVRDRSPGARLDFFALLKESAPYTGRSWGEAVSSWSRAVDRWTAAELDDALAVLLHADASAKGSRLSTEEQLLTDVVLALCGTGRRRAA